MATATQFHIHPGHPEPYKIGKVAAALAEGAIAVIPTDTVYALACDPRRRDAVERIRLIKGHSGKNAVNRLWLTLLCPSLADLATHAHVDNAAFKLMKALTPGPYTFILKATKDLPRLVLNPKRKTAGLRVPDNAICQALLESLGAPLASISATTLGEEEEFSHFEEMVDTLGPQVDIIIDDNEPLRDDHTTILDLTTDDHAVVREGAGLDRLTDFLK